MGKRTPGQLPLDDTVRKSKGSTERAAEGDLRVMRSSASIGAALGALEVAYRLTAREVDRAEKEQDRWGKLKAISELRTTRERLGPMTPADTGGATPDDFWARITAMGTAAGVGTATPDHHPEP